MSAQILETIHVPFSGNFHDIKITHGMLVLTVSKQLTNKTPNEIALERAQLAMKGSAKKWGLKNEDDVVQLVNKYRRGQNI